MPGRTRPAREFSQHLECFDHRTCAHIGAPQRTKPAFAVDDAPIARGSGEMHKPHGLARCRAARSGNSSDRDCEIDTGFFKRADRHRHRGFAAHGAKRFECRRFDAQHRTLGVVGIGDIATIKHIG